MYKIKKYSSALRTCQSIKQPELRKIGVRYPAEGTFWSPNCPDWLWGPPLANESAILGDRATGTWSWLVASI